MAEQPFALFIRGHQTQIFELADILGFETEMEALAVSIFEDDAENSIFHIQALYQTLPEAEIALKQLAVAETLEAFITQLPDEDWVSLSQKGLPPVEAGRFWVYGAHDKDQIPDSIPWPIHIEAGSAFGTGHHGTTKGCLLIFDDLLQSGFAPDAILDLGCGAGTLAIAAAKSLGESLGKSILATDIDPDAVAVTQTNAAQNNVGAFISAFQSDGFGSPDLKDRSFDLIFANILAGPLAGLAPDIAKALKDNGYVILSGILDEQADHLALVFENLGLFIKKGPSLAGWTSLLGKNKFSQ